MSNTLYEKVEYAVMTWMPSGTMSEEYVNEDGTKMRYDLGSVEERGHPFSTGFRQPEAAADTFAAAVAYVAKYTDKGRVWLEKITTKITREEVPSP